MFSRARRWRELIDSNHSRKKFLERRQELTDQDLYDRLTGIVDAVITKAQACGRVDVWTEPGSRHTTAWWDAGENATAQQTIFTAGRRDYGIYLETDGLAARLFPDDGPWLFTSSEDAPLVAFMPNDEFDTADKLLDWVVRDAGLCETGPG